MRAKIFKEVLFCAALFVFIAAVLLPVFATAEDPSQSILRGEVFTDPAKKALMPEEWVKRPIRHEAEAGKADVTVVMDQDIYRTLLPLIMKFEKENRLKISVMEGTCGIAAGKLAAKTADIGGFCCPAGEEDRLPGLRFHTLGIVAKAFFVHPDNPVDNLSTGQLRDIYRGKIRRWSDLKTKAGKPGPDLAIKAIGRLHCKTRPGHWRQLMEEKTFSPRLYEVGSIPDMIAQVAAARDAIGWEVLTMVDKYKQTGKVKPIRIDGYRPTDSNALAVLKYPFYRTYTVTTWVGKGVENKNARKLADYLIKEFEKLDPSKFGYVPAKRLKKAGWKFYGEELVGEPGPKQTR